MDTTEHPKDCTCSTDDTPKPTPSRRTCATPGCERIASGGAKHCRTCRAERPWREKVERLEEQAAHAARISLDTNLSLGLSEDANARAMKTITQLTEQVGALTTERDEAVKALGVSRGVVRGQKERLRRAKAEIATTLDRLQAAHVERDARAACINQVEADALGQTLGCEPVGGSIIRAVGRLTGERDGWRQVAKKNADEKGQAHMELASLRSLYGGLGRRHKALRLRLRIMYAVAALLGVAAVVGGVL